LPAAALVPTWTVTRSPSTTVVHASSVNVAVIRMLRTIRCGPSLARHVSSAVMSDECSTPAPCALGQSPPATIASKSGRAPLVPPSPPGGVGVLGVQAARRDKTAKDGSEVEGRMRKT
jgi:hypothetical protein